MTLEMNQFLYLHWFPSLCQWTNCFAVRGCPEQTRVARLCPCWQSPCELRPSRCCRSSNPAILWDLTLPSLSQASLSCRDTLLGLTHAQKQKHNNRLCVCVFYLIMNCLLVQVVTHLGPLTTGIGSHDPECRNGCREWNKSNHVCI